MTAYATYADIEHALDGRILAELCADGGVAMPGPNPMVLAALERASSAIRAYIRVGDIYSESEITTIAAAHDPLLVGIVVDLAIEFLYQRRGLKLPPSVEQRVKQAYSYCEGLRDGKMLFGTISQNATAGSPMVAAVPVENRAFYAQASASPFFPPRRGSVYP